MAGSMWRCTVKVADTDGNRLCATFKVWTYRCTKQTELILLRWFYTDDWTGCKHIWTQIEGCAAAVWWNPCCVGSYHLINSL